MEKKERCMYCGGMVDEQYLTEVCTSADKIEMWCDECRYEYECGERGNQ